MLLCGRSGRNFDHRHHEMQLFLIHNRTHTNEGAEESHHLRTEILLIGAYRMVPMIYQAQHLNSTFWDVVI